MTPKIHHIDHLSNKFYSMASKSKKSAAGIAFICLDDSSLFLCLRSKTSTFSNTWGIPGGKIESEESAIDAAIREIQEELGSSPDVSGCEVLDAVIFDSNVLNYTTFIVNLTLKEKMQWQPKLNKEHEDFGWFKVSELPSNLHPGVKQTFPIIKDILAFSNKIKEKTTT